MANQVTQTGTYTIGYAFPTSVSAEKLGKPEGTYYMEVDGKRTAVESSAAGHAMGKSLGLQPDVWAFK